MKAIQCDICEKFFAWGHEITGITWSPYMIHIQDVCEDCYKQIIEKLKELIKEIRRIPE